MYAFCRRFCADEIFIVRQLPEADESGRFNIPDAHFSVALHHDHAVGTVVVDGDGLAGEDGEFFGLIAFAVVADPEFTIAFGLHLRFVFDQLRRAEVGFFEMGIDVFLPVDDIHEVVEVSDFLFRHVFPEEFFGEDAPVLGDGLIHGVDVGGDLRFVGAEAARGV